MGDVALLMTGAVLLMNGLVLLGVAEARSVAVINIWGGLLQTVAPFVLLAQAHTTLQALAVGPPFLFGLTFLWVGVTTLMDCPQVGIGWYCAWVVPMTMVFAGVSYWTFNDTKFALVWLNYGLLWGLFAGVLGFKREGWVRFTGWSAVFMSFWAVSAVAVLELVDDWTMVPAWAALAATAVAEVAAGGLALRLPRPAPEPATVDAGPSELRVPVSVGTEAGSAVR
jgi:hypothetical protein